MAKLNAGGTQLVYSFALGGGKANAAAADSAGNAYVAGFSGTDAPTFPIVDAFQPHLNGGTNAFIMKLTPAGAIVWSTFLGGSADDEANGVAVDASGNVYIAGSATSTNFPLRNPLQSQIGGKTDAFVARINAAGTALVYSTYLGGDGDDEALAIAVDAEGSAHITGQTRSTNFPTVKPLQAGKAGNSDAFIATLTPQGSALRFSTYLGTSSGTSGGAAIALDSCGNPYVTGFSATGFPTTVGTFRTATTSGGTVFVARFDFSADPYIDTVKTSSGGPNIAQNTWIEIHGSNLSLPPGRIWGSSDVTNGMMPTALDQVSVTVDGKPAFVY